MYGKSGGSPTIPYQRIEYINSNNTSCRINTNITGNGRLIITAQANAIKGSSQVLIGTTPTVIAGTYFGEAVSTRKWGIGSANGTYTTISPTTKITADLTFGNGYQGGTVNGESISRSGTFAQEDWHFFSANTSIVAAQYPFNGKIYDAKIYQNDVLVRDFIPVRIDTVGYLYDTVSGELFGNLGTGSFTLGPDVN